MTIKTNNYSSKFPNHSNHEFVCNYCKKSYKHMSSLSKHLYEHTPEWNLIKKLNLSKHQQVQLLKAAFILLEMNSGERTHHDEDGDNLLSLNMHNIPDEKYIPENRHVTPDNYHDSNYDNGQRNNNHYQNYQNYQNYPNSNYPNYSNYSNYQNFSHYQNSNHYHDNSSSSSPDSNF